MIMSDSNSVLTRVPAEVWRKILLEVMHLPYLLDTTCIGSLFQLWRATESPCIRAHWSRSEWQRKLLRHVCKSWKHFADSKAYRSIGSRDGEREPHILAHARRAQLGRSLRHMLTTTTLWEVVEVDRSDIIDEFLLSMRLGCHPRLRRLSILLGTRTNQFNFFSACEFAVFCQLTFLHLIFPWGSYSQLPITTAVQVTLPNLEVLIWEDYEDINTPCNIFKLPTLRHFGWHHRNGCFPLSTFLLYASTLRSLSVRNGRWSGNTILLPDLNEFPHLEELSINVAFEIEEIKPVPPTYPLHTIYLKYLGSIPIRGVKQILDCKPVELRRIQCSNLRWGNGGRPEYLYNYVHNSEEIGWFADMCQELGIRVEDSKGRVRSEMPAAVELRDFTFWCVWNHLISSDVHNILGIWLQSQASGEQTGILELVPLRYIQWYVRTVNLHQSNMCAGRRDRATQGAMLLGLRMDLVYRSGVVLGRHLFTLIWIPKNVNVVPTSNTFDFSSY